MRLLVLAATPFLALSLSAHAAVRTAPAPVVLPADAPAAGPEAVATPETPSAPLVALTPAKKPAKK